MTPEGKVKEQIKSSLELLGCFSASSVQEGALGWFFMPLPNGYGVSGIPDFIGHYKGRFFAIEAKAPGGKAKPWQERQIKRISNSGGVAFIATCGADVLEIFAEFLP